MGEENSEAIWDKWYDIAGPLNKFVAFVTMGLFTLWWIFPLWGPALIWKLPWFICGIVGSILYLVMVLKPVADKDLTKKMHIFLIIIVVLCEIGTYWPGLVMVFQFVLVCILSDKPIWAAFSE